MIHPSYVELMQVVNSDTEEIGEEPVVNSRYSMVVRSGGKKPLSLAVQELYEGKVKIVGEDDSLEEEID